MAPRDIGAKSATQKHRSGTKVRPKAKAKVKTKRVKKTYDRDDHRHAPELERPTRRG